MARLTDRKNWYDWWFGGKQSTLAAMLEELAGVIRDGYDYYGSIAARQRKAIDLYASEMDEQMAHLAGMSDEECNRWCFYDMKKRGIFE